MAVKKKKKAKSAPRRRGRAGGRGRRVVLVLAALLLLAAGGLGLYLLNRAPAETPIAASVAQTVLGAKGSPGAMDSPRGMAVAPDGDLYVADLGNSRIAVYGPDGDYKFAFGTKGPGGAERPGQFNEPSSVAVGPDGSVYVADAWNHRVQKFSPKGRPEAQFGGGRYSFYSPRTVAVDPAGNLYVGDTGNSAVKVIDPSGRLIKTLGGIGRGAGGDSQEVFGVAVNAKGEIFVADHGNHRIHKFAPLPDGSWIKDRKVPGWDESDPFWPQLAVDRDGMVYAGDSGAGKVWVYDSDLNYRGTLDGRQWIPPLQSPEGLAFDAAGALWVVDMAADRLLKLARFAVPPAR